MRLNSCSQAGDIEHYNTSHKQSSNRNAEDESLRPKVTRKG